MGLDKRIYVDGTTVITAQNLNDIQDAVIDLQGNIGAEYNSSNSYSVGDYVVYQGDLYVCTTATTGTWDSSDWLATTIATALPSSSPSGESWTEQTVSSDGAVSQGLDAHTIYHFTGNLTSLTITLNATSGIPHYHFDFISGGTAPTLTMPNSVTMPDSFAVESNKRYEVDVLNNYGAVIKWTVS